MKRLWPVGKRRHRQLRVSRKPRRPKRAETARDRSCLTCQASSAALSNVNVPRRWFAGKLRDRGSIDRHDIPPRGARRANLCSSNSRRISAASPDIALTNWMLRSAISGSRNFVHWRHRSWRRRRGRPNASRATYAQGLADEACAAGDQKLCAWSPLIV